MVYTALTDCSQTDRSREEGRSIEPARTRAALLEETRAHVEPLRAMVDEHTALGRDLLELHQEYLAMCLQDLSQAEHQAQTADSLRRELKLLAQAAPLRRALLQHLLNTKASQ
jgi:hypothetical protein